MTFEKIAYAGWPNCYRLDNGRIELVATTDVGPRVIRCGLHGGENEFAEFAGQIGRTRGDQWRIYGGHRLWHAPEQRPRCYFPDNGPVAIERLGPAVRLSQSTEPTTGIAKQIDIELLDHQPAAVVTHRLRNDGQWPIELAPWAISVMAPGGVGIAPLPPHGDHETQLAPVGALALWAYTDLTDPRWTLGRQCVLLRQDAAAKGPQKIGLPGQQGWVAYARAGRLFVKQFARCACGPCPDFDCAIEMFTNPEMLEIETLGPLTRLSPGATVEHVERWSLLEGVPTPNSEHDVARHVLPRLPAGGE